MSYVSADDLQKYSNTYSDLILQQEYVDAAENVVNNYLGYSPTLHVYDTTMNGSGSFEQQLRAKPIGTLISVFINGESVPVSEVYHTPDSEFVYYGGGFPEGTRNVEVTYTAGWGTVPGDNEANGPDLPKLIKMTVLRIASLLQTESDSNIGVTSKSFADSGTRTFVNNTDYYRYLLPISVYRVLVI